MMASLIKTCEMERFEIIAAGGVMNRGLPILDVRPDYLPCAYKAKHLVIIKSLDISNTISVKLRVCDYHFTVLRRDFEVFKDECPEASLLCKFRRNRL